MGHAYKDVVFQGCLVDKCTVLHLMEDNPLWLQNNKLLQDGCCTTVKCVCLLLQILWTWRMLTVWYCRQHLAVRQTCGQNPWMTGISSMQDLVVKGRIIPRDGIWESWQGTVGRKTFTSMFPVVHRDGHWRSTVCTHSLLMLASISIWKNTGQNKMFPTIRNAEKKADDVETCLYWRQGVLI